MNKIKLLSFIYLLVVLIVIFRQWFSGGLITGGDYYGGYPTLFSQPLFTFYAWGSDPTFGLGHFTGPFLWIAAIYILPLALLHNLGITNFVLLQRLAHLYPYFIIGLFSIVVLTRQLLPKNFVVLSILIYLVNTYILMVIGGGQLSIALAFAFVPLAMFSVISLVTKIRNGKITNRDILFTGVILAVQLLLDIRITYILFFALFIYIALYELFYNIPLPKLIRIVSFPIIVIGLLMVFVNAFWVLPTLFVHQNTFQQLGNTYTSVGSVQFFSFAKFEDTISLLHPNWPENIFGKVSFMKPEFLLLPILAYSSLLFLTKKKKDEKLNVLFFALLGLIGAFLAKGANDPFGGIYLWMFNHIPGFVMFRDSTKWYTLVAISYALLIPFTISNMYSWLKERSKLFRKSQILNVQNLFLVITTLYLLFLIKPALLGQLTGTFQQHTVPQDYVKLEQFLSSQQQFSRTFWIPSVQRFGYTSENHSAISAFDLFHVTSTKQALSKFNDNKTQTLLADSSVKYIIIPYDTEGELFLKDRKYDNSQYEEAIRYFRSVPWVSEISGFDRVKVFALSKTKDHFWSSDPTLNITYNATSPVKYSVLVQNAKAGDRVVFAESYDSHWVVKYNNIQSSSQKYSLFNSFILPQSGNYSIEVYYTPQYFVDIGVVISTLSIITVLMILLYLMFRKK